MSRPFVLRTVLRQVSNALLKEFFEREGHPLPVDWGSLTETRINPVFDAWKALDDQSRKAIEVILQDVHEMATEEGILAIIESVPPDAPGIRSELDRLTGRYDKAMWTYLNHRPIWNTALMFTQADHLPSRYWAKRKDIPRTPPNISADALGAFAQGLSAFFRETQGRGHHCRIDHHERAGGQHYFFAYLDDYADTYISVTDGGEFQRLMETHAFETVFVYEQDAGTLELFAKGGKKVNEPLQQIFARTVLGTSLGPEDRDAHPYDLNPLKNAEFRLVTNPQDGIEDVRVTKLRLTVLGASPRRRIILEANPDAERGDIHEMMASYLSEKRLPLSNVNVVRATFRFTLSGNGKRKTFSFDVTHPNSSNLKSRREEHRLLGEKYLRRWGIDVADRA